MATDNDKKIRHGLNGRSAFLVAVAGAIFGGFSGPLLLVKLGGESVVRPDPFTGSQARQLQADLDITRRQIRYHLENHPDITNRFDARLTALEAQNAIILQNQGRIIDRLDKLNDR